MSRNVALRWVLAATAAAATVAWAGCGGAPSPNGKVTLSVSGGSPADRALVSPAFQQAAATVNREISLPSDLRIDVVGAGRADQLGISSPTYEPKDRTVYFPWSFVAAGRGELRQRSELRDAMVFVLYHELAHGLVDMLDLPMVGNDEDAADSFAAVFAIRAQSGGQAVPLGIAALLDAKSRQEGAPGPADYADSHELDPERAADARCLVHGSDPHRYRNFVGPRFPRERADTCQFEYQEQVRAWRRLLARWLTDTGGLRPEG